jgi:DNA-nicking Smr family endonuclease
MAESKDISRQDIELFRQAIGDVDRIECDSFVLSVPKIPPAPNQTIISEQNSLKQMANNPFDIQNIETGDELYFRRSGVQQQIMRKLRRGQYAIESELDLHGMTVSVAKKELKDFLAYCQSTNRRCIRIIHGKGHGSVDKIPVLKNKLNKWLQNYDSILAFCSAPTHDGGSGAIYALIKKF